MLEQCLARKPRRDPHRAPNIKPFPIWDNIATMPIEWD
jgi:hypothetical protein